MQKQQQEEEQKRAELQKKIVEAAMKEDHTLVFTKYELAVIFNVLTRAQVKYGEAMEFKPIIDKIEPIVAAATNIPEEMTKAAEAEAANHVEKAPDSPVITGAPAPEPTPTPEPAVEPAKPEEGKVDEQVN